MGTDTGADLRQGGGLAVELGGFNIASLLDEPDGRGDIVVTGAGEHARSGIGTVDAAGGLQHGTVRIKRDDHVAKIANAFRRGAKRQLLVRHVNACLAVYFQ
jgi:hypothetical protein